MNIDEYSWPALSQRTERKTGKIKPFLLPDLTILFWVNLQKALKLLYKVSLLASRWNKLERMFSCPNSYYLRDVIYLTCSDAIMLRRHFCVKFIT